jgi:hypothetical protein
MTKTLSKWFRKFHRWIAVPTALAIPAALIIKLVGSEELVAIWERLDKIPSILMLVMAITGAYLFLLPYIVKGQRKKRSTETNKVQKIGDAKLSTQESK